mmetsp:Transcript_45150/g.54724  ORF Transcript_45150/g.54724 Transcript_45150/m.54724 type:complete len:83 (+) Transcript_45150:465-713(+)
MKLTLGVKLVNKLVNTMKLSGIRYKLYIAARCVSGTMDDFIVPIDGKYIPTPISKTFIATKVTVSFLVIEMKRKQREETKNT